MNEVTSSVWVQLQPVVVNSAVAILIALIGLGVAKFRAYANAKIAATKSIALQKELKFYLDLTADAAETAVDYLEQVVKPTLLKEGIDRHQIQYELLSRAKAIVEKKVPEYGKKIIDNYVGAFSTHIEQKIEQVIQVRKIEKGE